MRFRFGPAILVSASLSSDSDSELSADAFADTKTAITKSALQRRRFSSSERILSDYAVASSSSSIRTVKKEASVAATIQEDAGSSVISSVLSSPPSWNDLSEALSVAVLRDADNEGAKAPSQVTLYRDTNGWCPFCERVWLILRAKGISYDEELISLQNKPEWYKSLVPTSLVPAVLFHGNKNGKKNERRIVWESSDIIEALDEEFPDTPKMVWDTQEYDAALRMNDDLSAAGFRFIYGGRNNTLSEKEMMHRKAEFILELDRLDEALKDVQQEELSSGFRLGGDFTAVDAIMIPTLERWRYQLPITTGIDIQEGRPALTKWFDTMDSFKPYSDRVSGDEYSWTATTSMFLRYFSGGEQKPEIAETIRRADNAAERIAGAFAEMAWQEDSDNGKKFSLEAAAKLIANHEAVVKDCTRDDPKSQQHIERCSNSDAADVVLRFVSGLLLFGRGPVFEAKQAPLPKLWEESLKKDAAMAARIVASRVCVPRDMSAAAASILRAVLVIVAERLEE